IGGALAGFRAGRDAQLQRRLPPCVYDGRPRLPVGLAVGAADQAPRACDSAHGLTGKERAISRLVAPGSRVTSEPDPTTVSRSAPFIRSEPCVCRRVRGWDGEFESGFLQRRVSKLSVPRSGRAPPTSRRFSGAEVVGKFRKPAVALVSFAALAGRS